MPARRPSSSLSAGRVRAATRQQERINDAGDAWDSGIAASAQRSASGGCTTIPCLPCIIDSFLLPCFCWCCTPPCTERGRKRRYSDMFGAWSGHHGKQGRMAANIRTAASAPTTNRETESSANSSDSAQQDGMQQGPSAGRTRGHSPPATATWPVSQSTRSSCVPDPFARRSVPPDALPSGAKRIAGAAVSTTDGGNRLTTPSTA